MSPHCRLCARLPADNGTGVTTPPRFATGQHNAVMENVHKEAA